MHPAGQAIRKTLHRDNVAAVVHPVAVRAVHHLLGGTAAWSANASAQSSPADRCRQTRPHGLGQGSPSSVFLFSDRSARAGAR
jgi:hypothetical protein